jgi:hypothetical protein
MPADEKEQSFQRIKDAKAPSFWLLLENIDSAFITVILIYGHYSQL